MPRAATDRRDKLSLSFADAKSRRSTDPLRDKTGRKEQTLQSFLNTFGKWLLLDSRVVDVTRSYNPIFITISSLKPFLFKDLINEWRFVDRMEA